MFFVLVAANEVCSLVTIDVGGIGGERVHVVFLVLGDSLKSLMHKREN